MPRQLPWLNKGATPTKTRARPAPKPAKRPRSRLDSDDEFFNGTVLESSRKGKERADPSKSEDELPSQSTNPSRSSTSRSIGKYERALSSSPPLPADLPPPEIEFMDKCVDRFDLRDDEWMMVEDEFLQTAKLFTRHLHLAEYERLKKKIQIKKEVERPTVPSVKPSQERQIQLKAEKQARAQKKALQDVSNIHDYLGPPKRASPSKWPSSSFSSSVRSHSATPSRTAIHPLPKQPLLNSSESDGDDLDAVQRPPKPSQASTYSTRESFAKPSPQPKSKSLASRPNRTATFDFLDEPSPTKPSQTSTARFTSPKKSSQTSPIKSSQYSRVRPSARPGRTFDFFDDIDIKDIPRRESKPKGQDDQAAKRETEREQDKEKDKEKDKRKSVKLDDIPTFLF